jgi:hypothetical protein
MDYVSRRLSSLAVVIGAFVAFLVASLAESGGLPEPVAIGAGLVAFVATIVGIGPAGGRVISQPGKSRQ